MAGNEPDASGKRWIMPVILDCFGLAAAFKCLDALYEQKPWPVCIEYGAAGVVLISGGILWAVFRKKIAEFWPWYQLRITKAQLAQVLQENYELRESLNASRKDDSPRSPLLLKSTVKNDIVKPQHNVQCVEFKIIHDSDVFKIAVLCFQNVPIPGKLLGKFPNPRLRVVYYDNLTGQEIADLCPIVWWDDKEGETEINAEGRNASVATWFEGDWTICEHIEPMEPFNSPNTLNTVKINAGEFRIVAALSGGYGSLSIGIVTGVLTLREDGTASFEHTSD